VARQWVPTTGQTVDLRSRRVHKPKPAWADFQCLPDFDIGHHRVANRSHFGRANPHFRADISCFGGTADMLGDGAGKCPISCSVGRLRMDYGFRLGRLRGSPGISETPRLLSWVFAEACFSPGDLPRPFPWQAQNHAAFARMIAHSAHWRISGISEWGDTQKTFILKDTLLTFACFWDPLWRPGRQFTPGPSVNGNHGTGLQGPLLLPTASPGSLPSSADGMRHPRETEVLSSCRFPNPHDDAVI
jgi:hypothetical protein